MKLHEKKWSDKKVFCADCVNYNGFGGPICMHPKFRKTEISPIRTYIQHGDPFKINKKNDCTLFKRHPPRGIIKVGQKGKPWWRFW